MFVNHPVCLQTQDLDRMTETMLLAVLDGSARSFEGRYVNVEIVFKKIHIYKQRAGEFRMSAWKFR
jgi:hypothetical protein